jgi:hypothetical protein
MGVDNPVLSGALFYSRDSVRCRRPRSTRHRTVTITGKPDSQPYISGKLKGSEQIPVAGADARTYPEVPGASGRRSNKMLAGKGGNKWQGARSEARDLSPRMRRWAPILRLRNALTATLTYLRRNRVQAEIAEKLRRLAAHDQPCYLSNYPLPVQAFLDCNRLNHSCTRDAGRRRKTLRAGLSCAIIGRVFIRHSAIGIRKRP